MPPKPRGRPRSAASHLAIVTSALAILEERGLSGITIEAVAARAKVGKPTIYRYWSNAHELAMAALMHQAGDPVPASGEHNAIEALRVQLKTVIGRFASATGKQAAMLMASADPDSEISKAFRNQVILKSRSDGRDLVAQIFAPPARLPCSVDCLLDVIYGPIFYRLLTRHAPLETDLADEIADMVALLAAGAGGDHP